MEIVPFKPEYLEEIILIDKECFPERSSFSRENFLYLWKEFKRGFLVAKEDKEILGFGICRKEKERALIFSLAVRKKDQGKKVGSQILSSLLEILKSEKIKWVILHVKETNEKAIKLYRKFGFQIKERIENYYSDKSTALLMEKILI